MTDLRAEVKEFLSSRRARLTPGQAGLPGHGGNRRVSGLRREEVAMATTLRLDEAECQYFLDLARAAGPGWQA